MIRASFKTQYRNDYLPALATQRNPPRDFTPKTSSNWWPLKDMGVTDDETKTRVEVLRKDDCKAIRQARVSADEPTASCQSIALPADDCQGA
ncbi:MAG: hypothetical protein OES35_07270 [Chromatiales bacterium]|nr:hypothetical protein [Chromatiales bacterium]